MFKYLMLVAAAQAVKITARDPLDNLRKADPELAKEIESHVHDDPELIAVLEEHSDEIAKWYEEHKDNDKAVEKLMKKIEEHAE